MEVVVTTGAIRRVKLHQIVITTKPTPTILQAECPSCRPTNSVKALKGKISHLRPDSLRLIDFGAI